MGRWRRSIVVSKDTQSSSSGRRGSTAVLEMDWRGNSLGHRGTAAVARWSTAGLPPLHP
jgi:hypothetical protein